ncbi:MAG TPA: type II secretion system minor pseudopilin GspJ [Pseudomonadales bacterium]
MHSRRASPGFTLIEVIIVLGIFAIIGLIGARIVERVLDNNETLSERGARLLMVQRAMQLLQRDVLQLVGRGVRDGLGDPVEPLLIGADGMIEFTRLGWRNPLGRPRAELQRVGYVLDDDVLYRAYWLVLDRAPDSEPQLQRMLEGVEQLEFSALDVSGNEHSFWPPAGDYQNDPSLQLAAIVLRMDAAPFGVIERIWPVPNPGAARTVGLAGGVGGATSPAEETGQEGGGA